MLVYHGSDHIIEMPVYHGSKRTNDYGYGFYTTESMELAGDSYFTFAQDFVAGTISLRKLSEAMHLGKLGEQIVLKSRLAFKHIRFVDAQPAAAEIYYGKKCLRDREARLAYRRFRKSLDGINELYMIDIMREGIENGDPRLL